MSPTRSANPSIAILISLAVGGCNACSNEVIKSALSPDRHRNAILFKRSCGATTGFSTQISVLPPGGPAPAGWGNVFVADDGNGAAPSAPWGGPWADIRWTSPVDLAVSYDSRSRVFVRMDRIVDVRVSYPPTALAAAPPP